MGISQRTRASILVKNSSGIFSNLDKIQLSKSTVLENGIAVAEQQQQSQQSLRASNEEVPQTAKKPRAAGAPAQRMSVQNSLTTSLKFEDRQRHSVSPSFVTSHFATENARTEQKPAFAAERRSSSDSESESESSGVASSRVKSSLRASQIREEPGSVAKPMGMSMRTRQSVLVSSAKQEFGQISAVLLASTLESKSPAEQRRQQRENAPDEHLERSMTVPNIRTSLIGSVQENAQEPKVQSVHQLQKPMGLSMRARASVLVAPTFGSAMRDLSRSSVSLQRSKEI